MANKKPLVLSDGNLPQQLDDPTDALDVGQAVFIEESAAAQGDVANFGQLWVKNDAPNNIYFTDDAGNDRQITYAGGAFHDGFSDFVANEHIDWTSTSSNFSTSGTLAAGVSTVTSINLTANSNQLILDSDDGSGFTTTITDSASAARVLTLPDATDTLVGKATTDTFTNKTFDANGTGNSLSNVDVADLAVGTDGELITWDASGNPATVAVGTATHVLTSNGAGAAPTFQAAAGGADTNSIKEIVYLPGSFESNTTTPASLEFLNGTNVDTMVRAFDDTVVEYVEGKFVVPGDVESGSTITLRTYSMAKTAASSVFVEYTFEHLALNDAEDFDPTTPFTSEVSGDLVVDATQDNIQEDTWTETLANLGWAANDLVIFRLSRTAPTGTDLTGDLFLFSFSIEIPRA